MDKQIMIEDYNENWALEYKQEAKRINELLGEIAISIEHIGSTSIKELGAKPIIDFMLGVNELTEIEHCC